MAATTASTLTTSGNAAAAGAGGGGGPLDDLTPDQAYQLLLGEFFGTLADEEIGRVLEEAGYAYETAWTVLQERLKSKKKPEKAPVEALKKCAPPVAAGDVVLLEISPSFFGHLQAIFGGTDAARIPPSIEAQFTANGTIYLPLERTLALQLYANILGFAQKSGPVLWEDVGPPLVTSPIKGTFPRGVSLEESTSLDVPAENLSEIMDLEAAISANRQEYTSKLSTVAGGAVLEQELMIEKYRAKLVAEFPGVPEDRLMAALEENCFNLEEAIQDIKAAYNLLSSASSIGPSGDSGVSSVFSYEDGEEATFANVLEAIGSTRDEPGSNSWLPVRGKAVKGAPSSSPSSMAASHGKPTISNDAQFLAKMKELVGKRIDAHNRLDKWRKKKRNALTGPNNQSNGQSDAFSKKIDNCNKEMANISQTIITLHQNYSFPNNEIDLHGLIISELTIILPAFLRRKLATLGQAPVIKKRIKLKIITGVGHTVMREGSGNLREHVEKYLNQKGLRFKHNGPGAFYVTLSLRDSIK